MRILELWEKQYSNTLQRKVFEQIKYFIKEKDIKLQDPFSIVFAKSYKDLEPRDISIIKIFFKKHFEQLNTYFSYNYQSLGDFEEFTSLKFWKCQKTMDETITSLKETFSKKQLNKLVLENQIFSKKSEIKKSLIAHVNELQLDYLIDNIDTDKLYKLVKNQKPALAMLLSYLKNYDIVKTTYIINNTNEDKFCLVLGSVQLLPLASVFMSETKEELCEFINQYQKKNN